MSHPYEPATAEAVLEDVLTALTQIWICAENGERIILAGNRNVTGTLDGGPTDYRKAEIPQSIVKAVGKTIARCKAWQEYRQKIGQIG